jgi:arginine exporter protein ArgO
LGAAAALWFSLVSFLINRKHIKEKINSLQWWLQKIFGLVLWALGLKILLE